MRLPWRLTHSPCSQSPVHNLISDEEGREEEGREEEGTNHEGTTESQLRDLTLKDLLVHGSSGEESIDDLWKMTSLVLNEEEEEEEGDVRKASSGLLGEYCRCSSVRYSRERKKVSTEPSLEHLRIHNSISFQLPSRDAREDSPVEGFQSLSTRTSLDAPMTVHTHQSSSLRRKGEGTYCSIPFLRSYSTARR
jgi:hypothetical protein